MDKRKKKDLQALVRDNVETGSALYSDALKSYEGLSDEYAHQVIDHAVSYVEGNVHTNGMENFWSPFRAGFFFLSLGFENGLGTALLGIDIIFLTASRNRVNASGPSIMSAVPVFIGLS